MYVREILYMIEILLDIGEGVGGGGVRAVGLVLI